MVRGELEAARTFWRQKRLKLRFALDAKKELADRFHVAWHPRAYIVSTERRLEWKQETARFDPEEVRTALRSLH